MYERVIKDDRDKGAAGEWLYEAEAVNIFWMMSARRWIRLSAVVERSSEAEVDS